MSPGDPKEASTLYGRFTKDKGEVMVLNDEPMVKNDPDREARKFLEQ